MSKSKNDLAWEKIFEKHKILDKILKDGHIEIAATKINEFREARLMTKFDHKSQLPKLFADNKLSILPIFQERELHKYWESLKRFATSTLTI
ncbi:MAG: hypothetical protein R2777_09285 [Chitinophagales bacterium]